MLSMTSPPLAAKHIKSDCVCATVGLVLMKLSKIDENRERQGDYVNLQNISIRMELGPHLRYTLFSSDDIKLTDFKKLISRILFRRWHILTQKRRVICNQKF